uniref:Uncharacterized protein n=1 Tax=Megaselia scalaris TaxID=36166 RepID=T1H5L0_MEGSC
MFLSAISFKVLITTSWIIRRAKSNMIFVGIKFTADDSSSSSILWTIRVLFVTSVYFSIDMVFTIISTSVNFVNINFIDNITLDNTNS